MSRLHVSPGQQAGAVGIDDGVAMGTRGDGMLVEEGGRVHRRVMRQRKQPEEISHSESDERGQRSHWLNPGKEFFQSLVEM